MPVVTIADAPTTPIRAQPPTRPSPLRDLWTAVRRGVTGSLTRESIGSFFKTLAWVVPLTFLIWVWAEREQVATENDVPLRVSVRSTDANRIVSLAPGEESILVNLTGPRSYIDMIRRSDNPPIEIVADNNLAPGTYRQGTLRLIRDLAIFRDSGITVSNPRPDALTIRIDELIERDVPVKAPPELDNILDGQPVFTPPTVKVRGPRAVIEAERGRLAAFADLGAFDELRTPGEHKLPEVRLMKSVDDDRVTLSRPAVSAIVRVKQADIEYKIPSMPIYTSWAPGLGNYRVTFMQGPVVPNVTVIGSQPDIEALKKDELTPRPKALLELGREDIKPGESQTKRLRYDLPPGLRVKADDLRREVEFRINDRSEVSE